MFDLSTTNQYPSENKNDVTGKKQQQPKQSTEIRAANSPLPVSIDDQLERFADILLDIYLTPEHEANQNN